MAAGPITRLTSRAWNWNAIRPPGAVEIAAWRATFHVPAERPVVERQPAGGVVVVGLVEAGDALLREAGGLAVADVRLGRLQRPPVGGDLETVRLDVDEVLVDVRPRRRRRAAAG